MAITRSPVSASRAQLRFSTTKTSGLSLSLRIASSSLPFAPSMLQLFIRQKLVEENQIEVAGDRKMVFQADLREAGCEIASTTTLL